MSYFIYREIGKARRMLNDTECDDTYIRNNAIIDCLKACFDKIVEINKYNPTNRRYFDLKQNWQLIREYNLEAVVENISQWLQAQDPRYDGRNWIENPAEIQTDFTEAEKYENGMDNKQPIQLNFFLLEEFNMVTFKNNPKFNH